MFAEIVGEAHEAVRVAGVQPYLKIGGQSRGREEVLEDTLLWLALGQSLEMAPNHLGY